MLDTIGKYFIDPTRPSELTHLPMTENATAITVLTAVYLVFVLGLGPWLMRNRKPMQLKNVILAYNVLQILMNLYMFLMGTTILYKEYKSFRCIGKMPSTDSIFNLVMLSHYMYFLNKVIDYMDTIFFVLRKSDKQITFLHIYHHIIMVYTAYLISHYYGTGGQHLFVGTLNSLVHVLMYGYYAASALQPAVKQTHWKRNITHVQLVQFGLALVHILAMPSDCQYPKALYYMNIVQLFIMISLFTNFYMKTYLRKRQGPAPPAVHGKSS